MSKKKAAKALLEAKKKGRRGDTDIVHVNPYEKKMLKAMGGSGTTNPNTGLKEYFSDEPDPDEQAEADWQGVGPGSPSDANSSGMTEIRKRDDGRWESRAPGETEWTPVESAQESSAWGTAPRTDYGTAEEQAIREESMAREKELYERQIAGYERLEDVYQRAPELAAQQAQRARQLAQRGQADVLAAQVGGGLRGGGAAAAARQAAAQASLTGADITQRALQAEQTAQIEAARSQVEAAAALERMGTPAQRAESKVAEAKAKVAAIVANSPGYLGGEDEEKIIREISDLHARETDPAVRRYYQDQATYWREQNWSL